MTVFSTIGRRTIAELSKSPDPRILADLEVFLNSQPSFNARGNVTIEYDV